MESFFSGARYRIDGPVYGRHTFRTVFGFDSPEWYSAYMQPPFNVCDDSEEFHVKF
jgi:hypothetical protein